ncbi:hypothetical protein [Cupriavidus campinensis]
MSNYEAQRAAILADITSAALTGAPTDKLRRRLADLDAREQAEREAQEAAHRAAAAERAQVAVDDGLARAESAVARLAAMGHQPTEEEERRLRDAYCDLAEAQANVDTHHERRAELAAAVTVIENRIQLLRDRAQALSALRLAGAASERDQAESYTVERDLETLETALTEARAHVEAARIPSDLLQRRDRLTAAAAQAEVAVSSRFLTEQVAAYEALMLDAIRALVRVTGAARPGDVYRMSDGLSWFIRTGALPK